MITTAVENLPTIWDDARDVPFFRITGRLFTPEFCLGASVLLASYDGAVETAPLTPARHGSSTTAPAGIDSQTRTGPDLIPVRVRRAR